MGDITAPYDYAFSAIIARELLAKTEGNIVFSPVGLCRMLEMLQEGMDYDSPIYERPEAQLVLPSCAFLIAVVEHIIVEGRSQSSYTNLLNRYLVHLGGIVVVGHITLC